MATNFPGSLDNFTNPSSSSTLDSPSHAAQHANINDAMEAVQTKLGTGAGTIGEWQNWTPTISFGGIAVSNTVHYSRYSEVNGVVAANFRVRLNAAPGAGALSFTLPVARFTSTYFVIMGSGVIYDASTFTTYTPGVLSYPTIAGRACLVVQTTDLVTNGSPFTFTTGDLIQVHMVYEAA